MSDGEPGEYVCAEHLTKDGWEDITEERESRSTSRDMHDYDAACRAAATRQGLDPIAERLHSEGIEHAVEQTGGFTMVVTIPLPTGTIAITRDGQDEERPYLLGIYPGDSWQEGGDEPLDHHDQTLDEVVAIIRAQHR